MKKRDLIIVILPLMLILVFVILKTLNKDNFSEDAIKIHELSLKQENILNVQEYNKMKDKVKELILIDLRASEDFEKGNFKNAKNIPLNALLKSQEIMDLSLKNKDIVLYSSCLSDCSKAWVLLTQMGYRNIYILDTSNETIDKNINAIDSLSEENEKLNYKFCPDSIQ